MATVFLDTNVFLYAAGREHPHREPCRKVLRQVQDGTLVANTSAEVVQELLYVVSRRGRPRDAIALARSVMGLFPELLPVTRADMEAACRLLERHPALPARDAVHVATMQTGGLDLLVSTDAHFDAIAEIRRIDPTVSG